MDEVLALALQEIALEGSEGIALPSIWARLEGPLENFGLPADEHLQSLLWLNLKDHSDLDFTVSEPIEGAVIRQPSEQMASSRQARRLGILGPGSQAETDSKPLYQVPKGHKVLESLSKARKAATLRVVAAEGFREAVLGIYELSSCGTKLNAVQREALEHIGRAREQGVLQSHLARKMKIPFNNFHYILQHLETRSLVTRVPIIVKDPVEENTSQTNIIHLPRYTCNLKVEGGNYRLEQVRLGGNLAGSETTSTAAFQVVDDTPSLSLICSKLAEAEGQVLLESELKVCLGYRMTAGHRTWRRHRHRLTVGGFIDAFRAEVDGKVVNCIKLVKPFSVSSLLEKEQKSLESGPSGEEELVGEGREAGTELLLGQSLTEQIYKLICASGQQGILTVEIWKKTGANMKKNLFRLKELLVKGLVTAEAENVHRVACYRLRAANQQPKEAKPELNSLALESPALPSTAESAPQLAIEPSILSILQKKVHSQSKDSQPINPSVPSPVAPKSTPRSSLKKPGSTSKGCKVAFQEAEETANTSPQIDGTVDRTGAGHDKTETPPLKAVKVEDFGAYNLDFDNTSQDWRAYVEQLGVLSPAVRFAHKNAWFVKQQTVGGVEVGKGAAKGRKKGAPKVLRTEWGEVVERRVVADRKDSVVRRDRLLKRLEEEGFVLRLELSRWLAAESASRKNLTVDRRTVVRVINKLQEEGLCKLLSVSQPGAKSGGRTRMIEVVVHHSVNVDSSLFEQVLARVKEYESTSQVQSRKGRPRKEEGLGAVPVLNVERLPVSTRATVMLQRAKDKEGESILGLKDRGYLASKMQRARELHRYLWAYVFGGGISSGLVITNNDNHVLEDEFKEYQTSDNVAQQAEKGAAWGRKRKAEPEKEQDKKLDGKKAKPVSRRKGTSVVEAQEKKEVESKAPDPSKEAADRVTKPQRKQNQMAEPEQKEEQASEDVKASEGIIDKEAQGTVLEEVGPKTKGKRSRRGYVRPPRGQTRRDPLSGEAAILYASATLVGEDPSLPLHKGVDFEKEKPSKESAESAQAECEEAKKSSKRREASDNSSRKRSKKGDKATAEGGATARGPMIDQQTDGEAIRATGNEGSKSSEDKAAETGDQSRGTEGPVQQVYKRRKVKSSNLASDTIAGLSQVAESGNRDAGLQQMGCQGPPPRVLEAPPSADLVLPKSRFLGPSKARGPGPNHEAAEAAAKAAALEEAERNNERVKEAEEVVSRLTVSQQLRQPRGPLFSLALPSQAPRETAQQTLPMPKPLQAGEGKGVFSMVVAVSQMPVAIFCAVLGSTMPLDFLADCCKRNLRICDLPLSAQRQMLNRQTRSRLSFILDVLQRIKLLRLKVDTVSGPLTAHLEAERQLERTLFLGRGVAGSGTQHSILERPDPTGALLYVLEHKAYMEEPPPAVGGLRGEGGEGRRHEFEFKEEKDVRAYWRSLHLYFGQADRATGLKAFPASVAPEICGSRAWNSVATPMSVQQKYELYKRLPPDGPPASPEDCSKIAEDLGLTTEQVLRFSYDRSRRRRLAALRNFGLTFKEAAQAVAAQRKALKGTPKESADVAAEEAATSSEQDAAALLEQQKVLLAASLQEEASHAKAFKRQQEERERKEKEKERQEKEAAQFQDQQAEEESESEKEEEEQAAEEPKETQKFQRRTRFHWLPAGDKQLVAAYAKWHAVYGLRTPTDWKNMEGLPATPVRSRRRLLFLRQDRLCLQAIAYVVALTAYRHRCSKNESSAKLPQKPEIHLPMYNKDTAEGPRTTAELGAPSDNPLNSLLGKPKGYAWDDVNDPEYAAALEGVVQAKRGFIVHRMQYYPRPRKVEVLKRTRQPKAPKEEAPVKEKKKQVKEVKTEEDDCQGSLGVSTAIELIKAGLLHTDPVTGRIPEEVTAALRKLEEADVVAAFGFLQGRAFVKQAKTGQPFKLSSKFHEHCSASRFGSNLGAQAADCKEHLLQEAGPQNLADKDQQWHSISSEPLPGALAQMLAMATSGTLELAALPPTDPPQQEEGHPDWAVAVRLTTPTETPPSLTPSVPPRKRRRLVAVAKEGVSEPEMEIEACCQKGPPLDQVLLGGVLSAVRAAEEEGLSMAEVAEHLTSEAEVGDLAWETDREEVLREADVHVTALEKSGLVNLINAYDHVRVVAADYADRYLFAPRGGAEGGGTRGAGDPEAAGASERKGPEEKKQRGGAQRQGGLTPRQPQYKRHKRLADELLRPLQQEATTEKTDLPSPLSKEQPKAQSSTPADTGGGTTTEVSGAGGGPSEVSESGGALVGEQTGTDGVHVEPKGRGGVPIRPWLDPSTGGVNACLMKGLKRRLLGLVAQNPGIPQDILVAQLDVVNPQSCLELLQMLESDGYLIKEVCRVREVRAGIPSIFGSPKVPAAETSDCMTAHYFVQPSATTML